MRWTFLFRLAAAASAFGISVLSARLLGANGYGMLQYVLGALSIVLVLGGLGLGNVVVRETARAADAEDWQYAKGLLLFALLLTSAATVCVATIAAFPIIGASSQSPTLLYVIGAMAIVLRQTMNVLTSFLNGLQRIEFAGLGDFSRDALLVMTLAIVLFVAQAENVDAEHVMALRLVAAMVSLGIVAALAVTATRAITKSFNAAKPLFASREWILAGLPLMVVTGTSMVFNNADVVMIGIFRDAAEAGPYHAAARGAELIVFALALTLVPLNPLIAKLHARGETRRVRRLVRRTTAIAFAIAIVAAGGLFVFAEVFLSLFGPDFVVGTSAMHILLVSQLVNVATGPVQMLLIMTKHAREAAFGPVIAAGLNVMLNLILIPSHGLEGAAVATAISSTISSLLTLHLVRARVWR